MADLTLPTPNKSPGDGAPADDTNLIIEAVNTLNSAVENISAGPQGPQGEPGTPGAAGANASVTVGSTNTGAAGSDAAVTNSGTAQNAIFNFTIPRGDTGVTGAAGAAGATGPQGAQGDRGPTGHGVFAGGSSGFVLAKASSDDYDTEWIASGAAPPVDSVDGRTGVVTLSDLYDAAGAAASAQSGAQAYADGLSVNYDSVGSAAAAQSAAQSYADGLAVNYDPAGSASTAQANAQSYADGLASNYDPSGSAATVAGNLSAHESATTTVHGIADTSVLVVTSDARLSDARTPTAHSTSHESGGSDELELAPSQITGTAIVAGDVHLVTFVTSATRPGSPSEGQVIYETDTNLYYGWKGSAWSPIGGGATGGGTDDVFYENAQTVTANYTITTNKNAMTAGPVSIDSGVTVTVPSGSVWTVV